MAQNENLTQQLTKFEDAFGKDEGKLYQRIISTNL